MKFVTVQNSNFKVTSFCLLLFGCMVNVATSEACPWGCSCLTATQVRCNSHKLPGIPINQIPTTVEHLSVSLSPHTAIEIRTDAFARLKYLEKINLDGNNITRIHKFAFRGLQHLQELSIQQSTLDRVDSFAFSAIQNATALLLGYSKIRVIHPHTFAGSANIRLITFNKNPIEKIEHSAFSGLHNVEHMVLPTGVKIIEPDAFNGLDCVGLIKLAFMNLNRLHGYTFRGISRIQVLVIQESDLGVVEKSAFQAMGQVDTLILANNKIDHLEGFLVDAASNVTKVRYVGNHLLHTPRKEAVIINSSNFTVFGNYFPCDCRLNWILDGVFANETSADFSENNFCLSPLPLQGEPIKTFTTGLLSECDDSSTSLAFPKLLLFLTILVLLYL